METITENHSQSKCRVVEPNLNRYIYKTQQFIWLNKHCGRGGRTNNQWHWMILRSQYFLYKMGKLHLGLYSVRDSMHKTLDLITTITKNNKTATTTRTIHINTKCCPAPDLPQVDSVIPLGSDKRSEQAKQCQYLGW